MCSAGSGRYPDFHGSAKEDAWPGDSGIGPLSARGVWYAALESPLPENIMDKFALGWLIGVPVAVISAALFLCTENVFPHAPYYLSLYF
jgi:hypothetical protein